jgi:membrane protease YdiL (CAAX protease family)
VKPLAPVSVVYLAFVLVMLPWVAIRRVRSAPAPDPMKRVQRYRALCVQLAIFGLLAGLLAWRLGIPAWGAPRQPLLAWGGAVGLTALFYYGFAPYRRYRIRRRDPGAAMTAPGPGQLRWWALVSSLAGLAEELSYRGVASAILLHAGLPAWAVVLMVSAAFGLGHADRGPVHVAATFAIGALLHVLVLATGSLWPAMATHAVYDFLAGWSYGRLEQRAAANPA